MTSWKSALAVLLLFMAAVVIGGGYLLHEVRQRGWMEDLLSGGSGAPAGDELSQADPYPALPLDPTPDAEAPAPGFVSPEIMDPENPVLTYLPDVTAQEQDVDAGPGQDADAVQEPETPEVPSTALDQEEVQASSSGSELQPGQGQPGADDGTDSPVPPLVAICLEQLASGDNLTVSRAIMALGRIRALEAVDELIAQTRNISPQLRIAAAKALGSIADNRAAQPLSLLLVDSNAEVRAAAARALGRLDAPEILPDLVASLSDASPQVRLEAAAACGLYGDAEAAAPLRRLLKDPFVEVQDTAAYALNQIKAHEELERLLEVLSGAPEVSRRSAAAAALVGVRDERCFGPLARAMEDESNLVRINASNALSELRDPRSLDVLVRGLSDPDERVRANCVFGLEQLGDPLALGAVAAMTTDDYDDARAKAAWALGTFADGRALEALARALGDVHVPTRANAASSLAYMNDPRAVDVLRRALNDPSEEVRRAAKLSLAFLEYLDPAHRPGNGEGEPVFAERPELESQEEMDAYVARLAMEMDKGSSELRERATQTIYRLLDRRAVPELLRILTGEAAAKNSKLRAVCVASLGRIGEPSAYEAVLATLEDDSPEVREQAVKSLATVGDPRALTPLTELLDHADEAMRLAATTALGQLGNPEAMDSLLPLMDDPSEKIAAAAVQALSVMSRDNAEVRDRFQDAVRKGVDMEQLQLKLGQLEHEESAIQVAAVYGLVEMRDWRAVRPLIRHINDPNPQMRALVCGALGELGDPSATDAILPLMADVVPQVRMAAAWALGALRAEDAVPLLMGNLSDVDPSVRAECARSLGLIGARQAVAPLAGALGDDMEAVRLAAAASLGAMDDTEALAAAGVLDVLDSLSGDESIKVRIAADEAAMRIRNRM